ncbi:MAG: DNA-3-methyladenine glycosylase protein [Actinomycetota bacterium]
MTSVGGEDGHAGDGVTGADGRRRCPWCIGHADYEAYHDLEWGRPPVRDLEWFEKVCLEGFQAGLSWLTILRRRESLRAAFAGFDPEIVARFGEREVASILLDPGVIRHRGKVESVVNNARRALETIERWGSLGGFFGRFAEPDRPRPARVSELPASTPGSTALSHELRRAGWSFVGPTTMYALMQANGLVDDHLVDCDTAPDLRGAASGGRSLL